MTWKTLGTRPQLAIGLVGAVLLGAAAIGALHTQPSGSAATLNDHGPAPVASAAEPEPRGDAPALPARRWKLGSSFVYAVSSEGSAAIDSGGGLPQHARVTLAGSLALTVVARSPAGVTLRGDLRDGTFQNGTKAFAAADLAAPFYASASALGEISALRFSARLPAEARMALSALAASLQLVAPARPRAAWLAHEVDNTGLYQASYRLEGGAVRKTKVAYLGTRDGDGVAPFAAGTEISTHGATDFTIDASGWPRSMVEAETVDMKWAEGLHITGSTTARATLTVIQERPDLVAEGVGGDLVAARTDRAAMRRESDLRLVGGKDWRQLTADVRAPEPAGRNRTQAQMSALLRVDPRAAMAAEDAILHGDLDENARKRVTASLGAAGTPEAQHALADVLGAPGALAGQRMDAAIALAQIKSPTPEAAAALDQAMGSPDPGVASTATLASGAMVNQMNTEAGDTASSPRTKDAVAKLVDGLRDAASEQEKLVYLQALGNTGDARAWPAIQRYLDDPNTTLRAAAAFSLRHLTGDAIEPAILAVLTDRDPGVRRAGASTLGYRADVLPLLPSLDTLMKEDPETSVRLTVIDGLKFKLTQGDAVVELVSRAAAEDPATEVRNLARQVLAPPKS